MGLGPVVNPYVVPPICAGAEIGVLIGEKNVSERKRYCTREVVVRGEKMW